MEHSLIGRLVSAFWLVLFFVSTLRPIFVAVFWIAVAVLRFAGYRLHRIVFFVALVPTIIGIVVMSLAVMQQVRIDRASSCATQGDASVMDSHTSVIPGPKSVSAVVRSEVCDYGFAQGGVVHYVFVTSPASETHEILALRYTSNNRDYSMGNPPQVQWAPGKLRVVVPKGTIYALTYRRNRIGNLALDYDLRPEEDDSFLLREAWDAAYHATLLGVFLFTR